MFVQPRVADRPNLNVKGYNPLTPRSGSYGQSGARGQISGKVGRFSDLATGGHIYQVPFPASTWEMWSTTKDFARAGVFDRALFIT